jgi:site-specific DNA-methyltransferase (adenine-specific)
MKNKKTKLMLGDNIESLKKLPDNSIDSIVTDPPYALNFMNKRWDSEVPSVQFWSEVYRVLKPGGHVLSFGGTRTYHRMVVNIEDAGFEIRDQIMWLYGSGFPKSHNIGKAVDKLQGNEREVVGVSNNINFDNKKEGDKSFYDNAWASSDISRKDINITKGQSPWEGWGTAMKPSVEPICVARKPLSEKSVAENVLKWGTGGINVDGCRVGYTSEVDKNNTINATYTTNKDNKQSEDWGTKQIGNVSKEEGRFPANIILDEIAGELLDEQSGVSKSSPNKWEGDNNAAIYGKYEKGIRQSTFSDKGGASRFFYQAKVSKSERNMGLDGFEEKETSGQVECKKCIKCNKYYQAGDGRELCSCIEPDYKKPTTKNTHTTVKPVNLMAYLCRLVTPPNGICLDPFMGSGSTGIAAQLEGFRFVGMEMDKDYFKIAEARIENFESYRKFIK